MPAALQPPVLPSEVLKIAETQWLFTEEELLNTPSITAGLPPETERENRSKGVNFILQVGIMLKLPQITLATASVFLHRFYMRHPMKWPESPHGFHHYEVGATSLFLATKVEENCRKMRELVIACCRVAQKDPHKLVDEQDKEYWRWRDVILLSEDVMLEAICFDLSLEPPYKTLFEQLMFFGEGDNSMLRNAAWAFLNDSYLTTLCLLSPSKTIAASALYAAAKHCGVTFPDDEQGRPWWEAIGVALEDIRNACNYMASVYEGVHSKASREGGIYERISEGVDGANERTRSARPTEEGPQTPEGGRINGLAASPMVSEGSEARHARAASDEGLQTLQEPMMNATKHTTNGGASVEDENGSRRKRQRVENGSTACNENASQSGRSGITDVPRNDDMIQASNKTGLATQLDGHYSPNGQPSGEDGLVSPKLDEVSEEGEVEA